MNNNPVLGHGCYNSSVSFNFEYFLFIFHLYYLYETIHIYSESHYIYIYIYTKFLKIISLKYNIYYIKEEKIKMRVKHK